jgi:hypothetical protein
MYYFDGRISGKHRWGYGEECARPVFHAEGVRHQGEPILGCEESLHIVHVDCDQG